MEASFEALLEATDSNPPESVRPCEVQKLINSLILRKDCETDGGQAYDHSND
jgi:hypothetical protein